MALIFDSEQAIRAVLTPPPRVEGGEGDADEGGEEGGVGHP